MDGAYERGLILVGVGFFAGAINTVAGGGSLMTIPALIFLGLPAATANATNRIGVFVQSVVAALRFARAGKLSLRRSWPSLLAACLGAPLGALLALALDEARFRQVIAVAMLVMLALLLVQPKRWLNEELQKRAVPLAVELVVFVLIGVYGGFLQAGVGLFLLTGLVLLNGQDLVMANGLKSLMVAAFTVPALVVYLAHDLVQWGPALALAAGSTLGAWWGTRLAVGYGPRLVRAVLIVVVIASALRLLAFPSPRSPEVDESTRAVGAAGRESLRPGVSDRAS